MYSIIDIETTGKSARNGKITEIAVYVFDGEKVVEEYTTLIHPEERVSPFITGLTGINNDMLRDAPKFYEVAKKIVEITQDTIFVAHNVGFDYGFIRQEFKRLGYDYQRPTLCTAKLSRKLLPGHQSYSLGKLCADLGIEINGRHRAYGDAQATVKLFEILMKNDGEQLITANPLPPYSDKDLHPELDKKQLKDLPQETGVYYFFDEGDQLLYIGKSNNIRHRVYQHLANQKSKKAVEMRGRIARIDYELTGSELIALLKESEEIKRLQPLYNRALKRTSLHYRVYAYYDFEGYVRLTISDKPTTHLHVTSFGSRAEAYNQLTRLAEEFELCQKLCGLFDNAGACFQQRIGQCQGACIQQEPTEEYNARAEKAIATFKQRYDNLLIIDRGRETTEKSVVMFEEGRYLGYGFFPTEAVAANPEDMKSWIKRYAENRDVHLIVWAYLRKNKVEKAIRY